jgi:hypothetical protein
MTNLKARIAGATLGAMIAIGVGGAGMAMAQTADPSTTTTTPPAAGTAPSHDNANCPNMGTNSSGTPATGMRYSSKV